MFLSFIVPVYNVEQYVGECLDSLLDQDIPREDYEIICVNDGSTDESLAVLRQYADRHTNIRVIDKPNGGVASARNAGFDAARGEYIWYFVPVRLGACTFTVGGFDGGFDVVATQDVTNSSGYTESFRIYRSANTGLGSTTVEVK